MKNLLIISFDLTRKGESRMPLAIGSMLSFIKKDKNYGTQFQIKHLSINMLQSPQKIQIEDFEYQLLVYDFSKFDFLALSAYVWNEYLTNDLITHLRKNHGFRGKVILGGYQISYSENLQAEYPDCQHFIQGHGEQPLVDILNNDTTSTILKRPVDFSTIPSPYLTGEIQIEPFQKRLRMETKRGCPYRCSFCAHRDLVLNKVYKHDLEKVFRELTLFKTKQVQKINIIDPIFNVGKEYLQVMKEMVNINLNSLISVQARFETIFGERGEQFLDLCEQLNIHLEFGLQTANEIESSIIKRKNHPRKIKLAMDKLNARNIPYEISLIYGLPMQTLDSFKQSIDFVFENGCQSVTAFPLMLLKGTELYQQKATFGFVEQSQGIYDIPTVIRSDSFTEYEWLEMAAIAEGLMVNERV